MKWLYYMYVYYITSWLSCTYIILHRDYRVGILLYSHALSNGIRTSVDDLESDHNTSYRHTSQEVIGQYYTVNVMGMSSSWLVHNSSVAMFMPKMFSTEQCNDLYGFSIDKWTHQWLHYKYNIILVHQPLMMSTCPILLSVVIYH